MSVTGPPTCPVTARPRRGGTRFRGPGGTGCRRGGIAGPEHELLVPAEGEDGAQESRQEQQRSDEHGCPFGGLSPAHAHDLPWHASDGEPLNRPLRG